MLKSVSIAALAAAAVLSASPASAEPFQAFVGMCLDTDATSVVAGGAAQAAGWMKMPAEMLAAAATEELPFREPTVYVNSTGKDGSGEFEVLMTGWAPGEEMLDIEGVRMDICAVVVSSSDIARLAAQLEERLGFAPAPLEDHQAWLYSRQGSRLLPENALLDGDDEDLLAASRSRKLLFAAVQESDGMGMLMLGAIRPAR